MIGGIVHDALLSQLRGLLLMAGFVSFIISYGFAAILWLDCLSEEASTFVHLSQICLSAPLPPPNVNQCMQAAIYGHDDFYHPLPVRRHLIQ